MGSRCRYVNEDPLGFTKQTETMLVGLGAGDLIPQFRKRNITSQGLAALSKQDFITLGADESLANDMWRQLRAAARKYGGRDLTEELRMVGVPGKISHCRALIKGYGGCVASNSYVNFDTKLYLLTTGFLATNHSSNRTNQLIKILTGANQQLHLIETFISYARLRVAKQPQDFVIDSKKLVRASQALCAAATCIIADVEILERNLQELIAETSDCKAGAKNSRSRVFAFLTGIGVIASILCALKHATVFARKA